MEPLADEPVQTIEDRAVARACVLIAEQLAIRGAPPDAATATLLGDAVLRVGLAYRLGTLRAIALAGEGGGQWRNRIAIRHKQLLREAEAEWEGSR